MKQVFFLAAIFLASCNCEPVSDPITPSSPQSPDTPLQVYRRWNSYEVNLPKGVVVGGEAPDGGDNWLSIQRPDGTTTVIKNVDPSTWSAVNKFDTIQ